MSKTHVGSRHVPLLSLLLCLAAPSQPAFAQVLRGLVRDSSADQAVEHARITLLNEAGETVTVAHSGDSGTFVATVPVFGAYTVSVMRIGFRPVEDGPMMLLPSDTVEAVYYLDPLPFALDPVIVKAEAYVQYLEDEGFYTREKMGFGYHVDPEFIERRLTASTKVADLISHLPRVRCRAPFHYYVDDVRMPAGGIDRWVEAWNILAIEFYPSNAGAPARYGGCSIVIWTRFRAERIAERRSRR